MKQIISVIIGVLFSFTIYAQSNTINYKALIKDNLGNVVANQTITVQLTIFENATAVYLETHTPTTDTNGIVVLNIGAGTTSDVFNAIDWQTYNHSLNVQVDSGSGLIDLGTTAFKTVPYAAYAENTTTAINNLTDAKTVSRSIYLGDSSGEDDDGNDNQNTAIGHDALKNSIDGIQNVAIGESTLLGNTSGSRNTAIGQSAMRNNTSGTRNTVIGEDALYTNITGNGNVAIGNLAGRNEQGSDKLYIDNSSTSAPLIWGDFTDGSEKIQINGELEATQKTTVPEIQITTGAIDGYVLASDVSGNASWQPDSVSSGLEALDEGNGIGYRLKGQDPANYGDIGENAVDLSYSEYVSTTNGASGRSSTAMGLNTKASGLFSTTMGFTTEATKFACFASGWGSEATGDISTAMGVSKAEAYLSTSIGVYNIGGGNPTTWVETDPLFEIGNNPTGVSPSNALTVLKNGTITAPSFDLAEITDNKALITKEYADANLSSSGLEALDEGNGTGWRLKGKDPNNYGNVGEGATDLSHSINASTTKGATGPYTTAIGLETTASGDGSLAIGNTVLASGLSSTAIGNSNWAEGAYSTAFGYLNHAPGDYATVMGFETKADALVSTSIGSYNIGGGNAASWTETDPIFEIGNGENSSNRDNALTVLKNGKVGLGEHQPDGFLEIKANNNTNEPTLKLIHEGTTGARINFTNTTVTNGNRWTLYGEPNDVDANSTFNIFHPNAGNIIRVRGDGEVGFNGIPNTAFHVYHSSVTGDGFKLETTGPGTNWWRFNVGNAGGNLYLYSTTGGSAPRGNFNKITGVYSSASDRRLKNDFKPLPFSWQNFMGLETLSYRYKTQKNDKRSLGLIAQDVERIYPELVNYNKEDDVYHLNYSGFGVVAIKAIQELKNEVNILKIENTLLKQKLNKLEQLEARLSALENTSNTDQSILNNKK